MRYAIFSDIHANRQAWESVLADIESLGVDTLVCLGDVVGYGPMPQSVLDAIRGVTSNFVLGNHDAAVCGRMDASIFNEQARAVIEWTRERIDEAGLRFLAEVPFAIEAEDVLFVHAEVEEPGRFGYVDETGKAAECFGACGEKLIFLGHTHDPMVYVEESKEVHSHGPADFHVTLGQRYLVNVGSVGEPRDPDDLRACYVIYDSEAGLVQFRRVDFDFDGYRVDLRREGLDIDPYFLRVHDFDGADEERSLLVPHRPAAMKRVPVVPLIPVKAGPPGRLTQGKRGLMPVMVRRSPVGSRSQAREDTMAKAPSEARPDEDGVPGEKVGRGKIRWDLVSTIVGVILLAVGAPVAWVLIKDEEPGWRLAVEVEGPGEEEADSALVAQEVEREEADAEPERMEGGASKRASTPSTKGDGDLRPSLRDGLLSYWTFDKGLKSGDGSMPTKGVARGKENRVADRFKGKALRLGGSLEAALGGKELYLVREGEAISFSVWVMTAKSGAKRQSVLANGGADHSQAGWGLIAQSKLFRMQASAGKGPGNLRRIEVERPAGWCHLAGVIDLEEGSMRLYLNGVLVEETDVSGLGTSLPASHSLTLGKKGNGKEFATYQGDVDDLAIWRRVLLDDEILAIYDYGKRRKAPLGELLPPMSGPVEKIGEGR